MDKSDLKVLAGNEHWSSKLDLCFDKKQLYYTDAPENYDFEYVESVAPGNGDYRTPYDNSIIYRALRKSNFVKDRVVWSNDDEGRFFTYQVANYMSGLYYVQEICSLADCTEVVQFDLVNERPSLCKKHTEEFRDFWNPYGYTLILDMNSELTKPFDRNNPGSADNNAVAIIHESKEIWISEDIATNFRLPKHMGGDLCEYRFFSVYGTTMIAETLIKDVDLK